MSTNPDVQPLEAELSNRLDSIIAEIDSLNKESEHIGRALAEKRDAQSALARALASLGTPEPVKLNRPTTQRKAKRRNPRPAPGQSRQDRVLAFLADGREYTTRDIRAGINEHNDNSLTVMLGTLSRKGIITSRKVRNDGTTGLDPRVTSYNLWKIA
jgi:hypothetical protein